MLLAASLLDATAGKGVARKALGRDWMVHAALRETADHTRYLGAKTDTPFVRLRPVGKPPGHALLRSPSIGIVTCCVPTASAMLSPRGCGRP